MRRPRAGPGRRADGGPAEYLSGRPSRPDRATPEETLRKIVREIRRRTVWQCLGIYLASAFAALQIVDVLTDNMGLPDWVFPFAVVLLVLGLPIVLATAIVQDRLPGQGETAPRPARDRAPEPGEYRLSRSPPPATAARPSRDAPPEADSPANPPGDEPAVHHRVFTWRNALAGGALAFLFLAVVTGGFMFMRSNGIGPAGTLVAKGVIDERSPILVAEFESNEDDAELARAMTEAFRIDFSQTNVVRLVEPARVAEALRRMELEPSTPVTVDVARRLARREGIPAIIGGTFSRVPGGFVLTGRIEEPDGTVLVSHRETAADSTEVLPAIDALSEKLRERLGESFTSLRADAPLEQVTTASLRALELYTEAIRTIEYEGDEQAGVRLLEEALEEDLQFASAWRKLGVVLRNLRASQARYREALTRAYELRDRLTPRERYLAEAAYYESVEYDRQRAMAAYERMLDLDPNDTWALNNLAVLHSQEGDRERHHELLLRTVALDTSSVSLGNLALSWLHLNRVDEADSVAQLFARLFPEDHRVGFVRALVAVHREDLAEAERIAREAVEASDGVAQMSDLRTLADVLRTTGRLREADRTSARAIELAADLGFPATDYWRLYGRFWMEVIVREDPAAARGLVEATLAEAPLEDLEPLDRPYLGLAVAWAHLGERERAEAMIEAFRRAVPDAPSAQYDDDVAEVAGELAFAEGRWDDAIAAWEESRRLRPECDGCLHYSIALAHAAAGRPDSALARLEREIDMYGEMRLRGRSYTLGPALERMAEILDAQGRLDEAAAYYSRFADLWADADPELQPRVATARARAEEIVRARG